MPMPGGWRMSMAWMRMPGQTWPGAAASFLGMWILMMIPMMLPALVPVLACHRRRDATSPARVAAGYFLVWGVFGAGAYLVGATLAAAEMRWPAFARAVPLATGVVILLGGGVQLTAWKARQLRNCRDSACARPLPGDGPWRDGMRLGRHCCLCCSGLIAILLVTGVMDPGVMGMIAAAITLERLAPRPRLAATAIGLIAIVSGALVVLQASRVAAGAVEVGRPAPLSRR